MSEDKHIEDADIVIDFRGGKDAGAMYRKRIEELKSQLTALQQENTEWQEQIADHCIEIAGLKSQLTAAEEKLRWIPVGEGLPDEEILVDLCNINCPDCDRDFGRLVRTVSLPSGQNLIEWALRRGGLMQLRAYTHWRAIDLPKGEDNG